MLTDSLPILKYCSAIWDPHHFNAIHQLEMIQHRAARFVLKKPWRRNDRDSVSQMLLDLKWPSLLLRKSYSRILLMYKVIKIHLIFPPQCLPPPAYSSTRAWHNHKFCHLQVLTNVFRYSFFPRTICEWNNLQINMDTLSLESFKQSRPF